MNAFDIPAKSSLFTANEIKAAANKHRGRGILLSRKQSSFTVPIMSKEACKRTKRIDGSAVRP